MNRYILVFLIVILLLCLINNTPFKTKKITERFIENSNESVYFYLTSKLNNKVLQLYKGNIDTTLVINSKKTKYFPQIWSFKDNYLISVFNNKYLTVSKDNTKVLLEDFDKNKSQRWNLTDKGYFVSQNNPKLSLYIEGGNTSEDAMVVLDNPIDKPEFKWSLEEVQIEVKNIVIMKEQWDCRKEKTILAKDIPETNIFSYSLWFNLKGDTFKKNEWKTVFLRGSKDTRQRTPSIFIHPTENKFHIRASTTKDFNEGIDLSKFKIQLDTWYYLTLVYSENEIQFYVNGQLSDIAKLKGSIIHKGDFYFGLCDCIVSNVEFINKPLSVNEITKRMRETDPESKCQEIREITIVRNNLVKSIDEFRTPSKISKNLECPPNKLGGNTITISLNKSSKIETNVNLLDNQYYDISLWVKSNNQTNIRPYYGDWSGEWKNTGKIKNKYKELKWSFLNSMTQTNMNKTFGFELNTKDKSKTTLFLPVIKIKVLRVDTGNVSIKEFRSNGTHSTCFIKEVNLNDTTGWCALKPEREKYYLQADFEQLYNIQKIHTRGRGDYPQWVTEYKIEYFDIYQNKWVFYNDAMVYTSNNDMNTLKTNDVSIITNKLRIYPVSFSGWPSMRIGFDGVLAKRDKCLEYKTRSEIEENLIEREKYLELYNRECKKISYHEYEKELEKEKKTIENLIEKLKKTEIDSKTYESKYNKAIQNIETLKKEIEKLNIEKEIIADNSSMSKIKLNERCEPQTSDSDISLDISSSDLELSKKKTKPNKLVKKEITMEDLMREIKKINRDLEKKGAKLEEIESQLNLLKNKDSSKKENNNKKVTLIKQKKTTENEIKSLKKQLEQCNSQFEAFGNYLSEGFVNPKDNQQNDQSVILIESVPITNENTNINSQRYDIRHHKQYKKLVSDIEAKLRKEQKEKKECKPFDTMDIRKHKDYPRVIKAIYDIAKSEFGDITKHQDYNKLVKDVEARTIKEYGRKTDKGYVRCPDNCELLSEVQIENHPKFRSVMREVIRKVIAKYGKPIPGTKPTLYQPCLDKSLECPLTSSYIQQKKLSTNNSNMNSQCLQNFVSNSKIETFADVYEQQVDTQALALSTNPIEISANPDSFDIRYHKQYPVLVKTLKEKCIEFSKPTPEQVEKLKAECSMKLSNVDITKNEQYQKLLKAYNDLVKTQKSSGNYEKLKNAYNKLKEENAKCSQNALIAQSDITRHPDISKYVLKSSLPIDLSVKKVYEDQITLLKSELARLQGIHDKCINKFDLNVKEGFVSNIGDTQKDTKNAQDLVNKINVLIAKLDKNLSIEDKSRFEEIKNVCRQALNFSEHLDSATKEFVKNIYVDIRSVENKEKKLEEVVEKLLRLAESKNGINRDVSKMVQKESEKQENKKQLEKEKKQVEKKLAKVEQDKEVLQKKTLEASAAIASVSNKLENPTLETIKQAQQDTEYLKRLRNQLENEKTSLENNSRDLRMKYDRLKQLAVDLEFKNKYMSEEILVLKKRCNERLMKLWEENQNIRNSLEARENQTRQREVSLDKRQKEMEEREERLNVAKGSQLERYQYLQNKIQEERSITDKYKAELTRLRDSIQKQTAEFDKKQLEMNSEISRVKDECVSRVDRYRRMYEEAEKLLDELRLRSIKSPELIPKIDSVEKKIATKVNEAIKDTMDLKQSSTPTVTQQNTIDSKLIDDMKKLVSKVENIEKKIKESNTSPENTQWFNNKYASY